MNKSIICDYILKFFLGLFLVFFPLLSTPKITYPQAIIVDHTCTDISRIPECLLEEAKKLTLHYAHTSHGSQITSGLNNLESYDSKFSVAIRVSNSAGLPAEEDPSALRIYDGNPPETYIRPEDYWNGESGQARTRAVATASGYNFSMWSWCGQVSGATATYIQSYLDAMNSFESEFPGMKFIYMTGHLDGNGSSGNLHQRNQQIREYCAANGKVLFDFADIERYDPDGNDYLELGAKDNCDYSAGNWAVEWCAAHPGSELCDSCSCAHSKSLNCNIKARAFWWMMARLAGWDPDGYACDLDQDGSCDMEDWLIFGEDWGRTDCNDEAVECECDLNGDDRCDMEDWLIFGEDWGKADCFALNAGLN